MTETLADTDAPNLLVGVDGSDTSWRAVYYAMGRARREQSTVIAVYVMPAATSATDAGCAALVDAGEQLAAEVRELAADYRVRVRFESTFGDPAASLLRLATQFQSDGIVLGASKTLIHKLFGSIPTRAVRHSPCPVTVVP